MSQRFRLTYYGKAHRLTPGFFTPWCTCSNAFRLLFNEAIVGRKRELVMGRGPLARWFRLLAPKRLDWMVIRAYERGES